MQKSTRVDRDYGAEERVEAVLAKLRSARPMPGLEERLLQRLPTRAVVQPVRIRDFLHLFGWPGFRRSVLAWGAACVAALLMVAAFIHHGRTAGQRFARAARPGTAAAVHGKSRVDTVTLANSAGSAATPKPSLQQARHSPPGLEKASVGKGTLAIPETDPSSPMRLVNEPAPVEALTAQERLLLRLGLRHAPQDLLAMTPAAEEAQGTAERKQYAMFFAPAFRTVEEIEAMQKQAKQ